VKPLANAHPVAVGQAWSWRQGLAYGALGLPLAFVALPLYVQLPHHYAQRYGVPLATLGGLLLAVRVLDAVADPWLGRWVDRAFARSPQRVWRQGGALAVVLALGLGAAYAPGPVQGDALLLWVALALVATSLAYSGLTIAHHSWGARLGGNEVYQGQVVAWREGAGLLGVVLASVLPTAVGVPAMLVVFAVALAAAVLVWRRSPQPPCQPATNAPVADWAWPWRRPAFRALMAVFVLNGMASAVPATLFLFFVQDRLQVPSAGQPVLLGTYFVMAAVGLPLWLRVVRRWGLARAWAAGMGLSVLVFAWAMGLGAGDVAAFAWVCALSGLALGADLALPGALLAGVIDRAGDRAHHASAYFGWWQFAAKLNLALAAGLALPLLAWWGYTPGSTAPDGLRALAWAYAGLPCVLKLAALAALWGGVLRHPVVQEAT
jgi:glycoside/pentoside/hexuronide:cation symporter, GPH family